MSANRRLVLAGVAILAVFWSQFVWVRATNFGGWDEWLIIELASRGLFGVPYQNRPLSWVFNFVGSLLSPHGVWGFYAAHGLYLAGSGLITYLMVRRLAPNEERLALLAGILGPAWAPLDETRLDVVLTTSYSGATFVSLLALLLLVESYRRRSMPILFAASGLGALVIRCVEATAGLIAAGPLLLLALPADAKTSWRRWAATWTAFVAAAVSAAAWPLVFPPPGGSYQTQGLGFDPNPLRVIARVLRQFAFHLVPLGTVNWGEVVSVKPLASAGIFLFAWSLTGRSEDPRGPGRSAVGRLALLGFAGGALGYGVLALTPSITTAARAQILSAPGIGLLLASAIFSAARRARRGGDLATALLGAWVIAVGTGRVVAMQDEWDRSTYWPAQRHLLTVLVNQVPDVSPGTFIVLLEGTRTWPATFTFHHALEYLYERRAVGVVWGAEPFLYSCVFLKDGVLSLPAESIRVPWREPVRLYPYQDVVVLRALPDGGVRMLEQWPDGPLPALPAGALYAPRRCIRPSSPRPRLQILTSS